MGKWGDMPKEEARIILFNIKDFQTLSSEQGSTVQVIVFV
jgi:hypothetical protein